MPRIFTTQSLEARSELVLEEGPARHVAGALRLKPGSAITLFNGKGGEYPASLVRIERKQVVVAVENHLEIERESSLPIHLGIAISRGERMDWIVQKSTELGVSEITPLTSERSEVKLRGDRLAKKILHWKRVATSACEQCGRNTLPRVHSLQAIDHWVGATTAQYRFVLHHRSENTLDTLEPPLDAALLIGPEGGLSTVEIDAAEQSGFLPLTLGPRVLRTETAPLAALAILQTRWGDMG